MSNKGIYGNKLKTSFVVGQTLLTSTTVDPKVLLDVNIGASDIDHASQTAYVPGDSGTMTLAVRQDVQADLAGADGDYAPLQLNDEGALRITSSNNGIVSSLNSNSALSQVAYTNGYDTAQSGTATTITLNANASASDNTYDNFIIAIPQGLGAGQARAITSYVGATRVATISPDWAINPDSTSTYIIFPNSGTLPIQSQSNSNITVKLSSSASSIDNFYSNCFIRYIKNNGLGEVRAISSYDGTTKVAVLDMAWIERPNSGHFYTILGEAGLASSGSTSTIVLDGNQSSLVIAGLHVYIYSGTGSGQCREISSINVNTITTSNWLIAPDNTSRYSIFGGWCGTLEDTSNYSTISYILSLSLGENAIINPILSDDSSSSSYRRKYVENSVIVASGIHEIVNVSNYFQLSFVAFGTTLTGSVQTLFHIARNKHITSYLKDAVTDSSVVELQRSVITGQTGNSKYKNASVDTIGSIYTRITNPLSAYGEISNARNNPEFQITFHTENHPLDIETFLNPATIVTMVTKGTGSVPQVQYIYLPQASQFTSTGAGNYFFLYSALDATTYYVWFNVSAGNSDPAPGGTGITVAITTGSSASAVATAMAAAVTANVDFTATVLLSNLVSITNAANGASTSLNVAGMPSTSASTVTNSSGMAVLTPAASIGGYSIIRSRRTLNYRAGQGCMIRFSTIFDSPTVGTQQQSGIGNQNSGYFFGYDNTGEFGILHRSSGNPEIRLLTVTVGAGGAETATITVDGIDFKVALTAGSTTHAAYEISSFNFKPGAWAVDVIGATVYFLSDTATGARSNAYSFSSTGTATATWSTLQTGVAITNTWVQQNDWNKDRMDGFGSSGITLNHQKGNVYEIEYQYLGFGTIKFKVENPETGFIIPVHVIEYPNTNLVPSVENPNMAFQTESFCEANVTPKVIKIGSTGAFLQGPKRLFDPLYSTSSSKTTSSANQEILFTLKNVKIYRSKIHRSIFEPLILNISNDGNKSGIIRVYINGTLNETNYVFIDENNSVVVKDTTATTVSGTVILTNVVGGLSTTAVDLQKYGVLLQIGGTLTVTIQRTTATNIEISGSISWVETH